MSQFSTSICKCCNKSFEIYRISFVNGKEYKSITSKGRKYCYICSPYGTQKRRHPHDVILDVDGQRRCYKCKERKPLNNEYFPACKTANPPFEGKCRKCASKITSQRQKNDKLRCLEYKGGKCSICGYNKSIRSLCFHHLEPQQKDFTIAKYRTRAWETLKAELDKCILVCANCHGEIHDGIIAPPTR